MEAHQKVIVSYTAFQKVGIPSGAVMFLVFAFGGLHEVIKTLATRPVLAITIFLFSLWFLYLSYAGFRLTKGISTSIVADETGMNVKSKGQAMAVPWAEVGSHSYSSHHRILRVFDRQGSELFSVDGAAPGCSELLLLLRQLETGPR